MLTPKRFIFLFGLCTVLFIMLVGMINYMVNPFLMFQQSEVNDIFTYKPEAATRVRTFKKYQAIKLKFLPIISILCNKFLSTELIFITLGHYTSRFCPLQVPMA